MSDNNDMTNQQLLDELVRARSRIAELESRTFKLPFNNEDLHSVIDPSPVAYALNDDRENIIYLNPAFSKIFGYDLSDIATLDDWWPKAYPDPEYQRWVSNTWLEHLEMANNNGEPFEPFEVKIRCKDNSEKTVIASASSLCGIFEGIHLVTLYDITQNKLKDIKLRESEARFSSIFECIDEIAVQGYDQDRRVTYWNPASVTLYGYSKKEAMGQKLEDLIIPDEMHDGVIQAVSQWVNDDIPIPATEQVLKNKKGQPVTVYSSHALLKTADGNSELFCIDIKMDELRQTKKELQRVNADLTATLRAIPDSMFEIDEHGRYINLWARNEELLAAQKQNLLGSTVFEQLPGKAASIIMDSLKLAEENNYSQGQVIYLPLPTGGHWFELSTAMKPGSKNPKHFFCLSRDITERKHAEEQLRRSQKMEALGKLTGGIAHDFNNMLNVILGYAELLGVKLANDIQSSHYINKITTAGNRAKALTSKLLAFSRKGQADKKTLNIDNLLERGRHMLEKTLTAKISLVIDKSEDLWSVYIDQGMFTDSILNMSINSMHAMADGGELRISTKNRQINDSEASQLTVPSGDYVQLVITDTGCGITPEIRDKIFEPFFTTKGEMGTGLGLSQVYGFVKQSEGAVQVISEPGKGTEISIYIPRYVGTLKDECCITKSPATSTTGNNETILVVDDEPALRELVEEVLQSKDYRVLCAENGEDALRILTTEHVDLLLTDVIMPGIDGYQLASEARKQFPEIKIVVASGYSERANAQNSNDSDYQKLVKPYNLADLLTKVREMLDE